MCNFKHILLTCSLCFIGVIAGGCTRTVLIHSNQTDDCHYIMVKGEKVYDCYSKVDGKWVPTCKEVKTYDLDE